LPFNETLIRCIGILFLLLGCTLLATGGKSNFVTAIPDKSDVTFDFGAGDNALCQGAGAFKDSQDACETINDDPHIPAFFAWFCRLVCGHLLLLK
jgi:hypothetical protein